MQGESEREKEREREREREREWKRVERVLSDIQQRGNLKKNGKIPISLLYWGREIRINSSTDRKIER